MIRMNENPYSSPQTPGKTVAEPTAAEATRKQYLSHEASVKSIGTLYFLGAIVAVSAGALAVVMGIMTAVSGDAPNGATALAVVFIFGVLYFVIGLVQGATAIGLRKLQPWARIVAIVFSVIGLIGVVSYTTLIGIPIGTLISGYFLYLLLSKKGGYVFSDEYKQIIEQTPHIKYRTSIIVLVFLILLLLLFVVGILAAIVGSTQ